MELMYIMMDSLAIPNKLAKDKQIYKIISSNVTLDDTYHSAICGYYG